MNVLLVTIDCLRHDKLGCAGGQGDLTPNIDRFSQDATVFSQAVAQGYNTRTSFPSLFTSTYPNIQRGDWGQKTLVAGDMTLAGLLRQHGFATGGFHSNPWLSTHFGFGQEYDTFEDNLLPSLVQSRSKLALRLSQLAHVVSPYLAADDLVDQALDWIKGQRDPFFAWVHFMDAHGPYRLSWRLPGVLSHPLSWGLYRRAQTRPETITDVQRRKLLHRYEGCIRFLDGVWGRFVGELEASGQLAETLVVFTADHGEAFGEHGYYTHGDLKFFDEVIRVPLVIYWPGRETKPRVDGQVELTTIVPTVLDILGLPIPDHLAGTSSVPWLRGEASLADPVNAEALTNSGISENFAAASVRTHEWKYVLHRSMARNVHERQLYHLATDPGEQDECSQRYPEVVARLNERAEAHMRRVQDGMVPDTEGTAMPEEVVARLRALGYMD